MSDLAKEITPINIDDELKSSYLDYAMSVIVGRALPDVFGIFPQREFYPTRTELDEIFFHHTVRFPGPLRERIQRCRVLVLGHGPRLRER